MKIQYAAFALSLVALVAVAVAAAAAPQHLDYSFRVDSAMPVPAHGGVMRVTASGTISFELVSAEDNLYTYAFTVNVEKLNVTGFPGNDTQAAELIKTQLQQAGNITIDYSNCKVGRVSGSGIAAVAIYCDTKALERVVEDVKKSFQQFNIDVDIKLRNRDGGKEVVVEGKGIEIRLFYGGDGVLREYYSAFNTSVLAGHAAGGYNIVELKLLNTEGGQAAGLQIQPVYIAVGAGVAAIAAAALMLARRR